MRGLRINLAGVEPRVEVVNVALPVLGPREVRVRTQAVALNFRDLALFKGTSAGKAAAQYVPFSDACGIVEEIGSHVTAWNVGDRVCSLFFPDWRAGRPEEATRHALGSTMQGVGQEAFIAHDHALASPPHHLTPQEAAALPCAGLTAWNALRCGGAFGPDKTILLQGTGAVSMFALQFAKAAGAHVIMTSSSDAKLERASSLGADATLNYRSTPNWSAAAKALTGGRGVDLVIEVGGAGTFAQSLEAIRLGGHISVVGMLAGGAGEIDLRQIYAKCARISGITVGSRQDFEDMARAITRHEIRPLIADRLPWTKAATAMKRLEQADHLGKIILDF